MKKTIATFFLTLGLLINFHSTAQSVYGLVLGTTFTYQPINANEHQFIFQTSFSFGAGNCDAAYVGNQITIEGDTLSVIVFYDVYHGFWATMGGGTTNTVVYHETIPSSVHFIKMSTYVITSENTPPYAEITIPDVYYRIIDYSLSVHNNTQNEIIPVAPNPTSGSINISNDIPFEKATVVNTIGQVVKDFDKNDNNNYDIRGLQSGLYYIQFYNADHKNIGTTKIIKQ